MRLCLSALMALACFAAAMAHDIGDDIEQPAPEDLDTAQQIRAIASEMDGVTDKLRADRTDKIVQFEINDVEDKMQKLFEEIEEREKRKARGGPGDAPISTAESLIEKKIDPRKLDPKRVRKCRFEVQTVWAREIPLKWKARIGAYFYSLLWIENVATNPEDGR